MESKKDNEIGNNIPKNHFSDKNSEEDNNTPANPKKVIIQNEQKEKEIFKKKLSFNKKFQIIQQNNSISIKINNSSLEENNKDEANIKNESTNEIKVNDKDKYISKMNNFRNKNDFIDQNITENKNKNVYTLLNSYYKDIDLKFKKDDKINNNGKNFLRKNRLHESSNNFNNFQNYSQYSYSYFPFFLYPNQLFNKTNYFQYNNNQGLSYIDKNFIMKNNRNHALINNMNYNFNDNKNKFDNRNKRILEYQFFIINIENILKGIEKRTTIMIRHIPNKYSYKNIIEEINIVCKDKYDFFYLPLDSHNNCNLGYAFINFINSLHIIYFYKTFKSRKWQYYNSYKECDLTFAKFQGKSELTANIEKNLGNNENKKRPMIFEIKNPPKIDLFKEYYNIIKEYKPEVLNNINWI